ncbi:MAG: CinA family protein [Candidatus Spyradocola sp.]|nr:CinA family protein [Candidatus Spyradocola sp.]
MALQDTAQALVDLLLEKKLTISLAESCTGGMIAAALVDCPGVSDALLEGCVCYSNAAKMRTLGVLTATLQQYGAVSEACALEMVHGICDYTGSDTAIAVTGIAGPGGGTAQKPVGTVYIAALACGRSMVTHNLFSGDRLSVRTQSAVRAMEMLMELLKER